MSYTELTVWTRGIIMDKEGRDIVNSVSASAPHRGQICPGDGELRRQSRSNQLPDPQVLPRERYHPRKRTHLRKRTSQHRRAGGRDDGKGMGLHARHASRRNAGDQHALHARLHDSFRSRSRSGLRNWFAWMPQRSPTTNGFTTGLVNSALTVCQPKAPPSETKRLHPTLPLRSLRQWSRPRAS